jgi:hypothetical protein
MLTKVIVLAGLIAAAVPFGLVASACNSADHDEREEDIAPHGEELGGHVRFSNFDADTDRNSRRMLKQGREIFRFDTFGDEEFWGGELRLHEAIARLTPTQALELGLKVDADALPRRLRDQIKRGEVDLDDPAVTLRLLQFDAVLGVTGFFDDRGGLTSLGIQCAFCHSTVNDSVRPGIGKRLDGWANRDLDVGRIIASAPNLAPLVARLPGTNEVFVREVLNSWGPGKFDALLFLDGQAFQPDGRSAATMLPNAYDMAGFNLHTWTGDWGSVPYWNAFVAVVLLRGKGNFFDPRLNDATKFPIAAALGLGNVTVEPPEEDLVTSKLPALHFYQVALPSPKPRPGVDFNEAAAERGHELFIGQAHCNNCHREPLWTDPGWNLHTPEEMMIDDFQANRAPGSSYKTMNLAGLFIREQGLFMRPGNEGRFYHDGRFATLLDVVRSYNERFGLGLTSRQKRDLVEYLKSL